MQEEFFTKENIFVVVGASNNTEKYGYKVFADLKKAQYNVIAINNRVGGKEEIQGTPSYASLSAFFIKIKELFDDKLYVKTPQKVVLVLVVPPENTAKILADAHTFGVNKIWFQPGSQSVSALEFCKVHNMHVIHDECIMLRKPQ